MECSAVLGLLAGVSDMSAAHAAVDEWLLISILYNLTSSMGGIV